MAPSVPWHCTFTGILLTNTYYWCNNQVIMQRVLAAESLSHGQKGVIFASLLKVASFAIVCAPGIVGIMLQAEGVTFDGVPFIVEDPDAVYPLLVKALMPRWSLGFFSAVLIGSVLSTFNSALNSASTIFGLEIYKIYLNPDASDELVIKVSLLFGCVLTILSFVIAPQLHYVENIFNFLQHVNSIVSLPIVVVFIVGISTTLPDAYSAKVGFCVGVVTISLGQFMQDVQWLHIFFIAFVLSVASTMVVTYIPALRKVPELDIYSCDENIVNTQPWRWTYPLAFVVTCLLACLVISLQFASAWLALVFLVAWLLTVIGLFFAKVTTDPKLDPACLESEKPYCQSSSCSSSQQVEGHSHSLQKPTLPIAQRQPAAEAEQGMDNQAPIDDEFQEQKEQQHTQQPQPGEQEKENEKEQDVTPCTASPTPVTPLAAPARPDQQEQTVELRHQHLAEPGYRTLRNVQDLKGLQSQQLPAPFRQVQSPTKRHYPNWSVEAHMTDVAVLEDGGPSAASGDRSSSDRPLVSL